MLVYIKISYLHQKGMQLQNFLQKMFVFIKISYLPQKGMQLQGVPQWNGQSNLPLTDRNMQVTFDIKVVLKSWDKEFYENVS